MVSKMTHGNAFGKSLWPGWAWSTVGILHCCNEEMHYKEVQFNISLEYTLVYDEI